MINLGIFAARMISLSHERKFGPKISEISKVNIPEVSKGYLDNRIPFYTINLGTQDVLKFEWVFKAGRPFETKNLAARATASVLKEGTASLSSFEIAEKADFLGATLQSSANFDTASITVYCLRKHFQKLLPLIRDIWESPSFPEQELEKFKLLNQENLKVELSKNDVIAYRELTSKIFGESHPYGYNSYPESYKALEQKDIISHYNRCFGTNNSFIVLSGKLDSDIQSQINKYIGEVEKKSNLTFPDFQIQDENPSLIKIQNKGQYQGTIRIGRKMFPREHPDYASMFVLNTVLGGYFGSRLMRSIREEKGFTYNIYSALDSFWLDGYFYIHTELDNKYIEQTRSEIYKEIDVLQSDLIPEKELKMVKNYLMGNILGMLDGPFRVSKVVKSLVLANQQLSDFEKMVEEISAINAKKLRDLAQYYLGKDKLWEIIVSS